VLWFCALLVNRWLQKMVVKNQHLKKGKKKAAAQALQIKRLG